MNTPLYTRTIRKHRKYLNSTNYHAKTTYILNTYIFIQISQGSLLSNKPPLIQNGESVRSFPGKKIEGTDMEQGGYLDARSKTCLIRPAMICISSIFKVGCTRNIRLVPSSAMAFGNLSAGPNPASLKAFSR